MPVIACPECAKKLNVPETAAGKRVRCPGCQAVFSVPTEDTATPPTPLPGARTASAAQRAPVSPRKAAPPPEPEPDEREDETDDEAAADVVPGLQCAKCEAAAVKKLPPNQFSRRPGYVCLKCDTHMRRAGTTGNYYAAIALGAFVLLLGLGLCMVALGTEQFRGRMTAGAVGIAALGAVVVGWAVRQVRLPVPLGATAPPSRIGFWIAVIVIGLLLAGGGVFALMYAMHEML